MKHFYKYTLLAASLFALSNVYADEKSDADKTNEETVKASFKKHMPEVTIDSVKPSEVSGLQEVISGGNIFYSSNDGKYVIQGYLIDLAARKNITDEKLAAMRLEAAKVGVDKLKNLGEDNMIIFKPKETKHTVTVFTDIDCGYCRKLHSEMDSYLAEGITVQYLFFPRAGKGSESYDKAISVWCATDRNKALTAAKAGEKLDKKTCKNPVDDHIALAEIFGIQGTPLIVTEQGNILPGYLPAKKLAEELVKETLTKK